MFPKQISKEPHPTIFYSEKTRRRLEGMPLEDGGTFAETGAENPAELKSRLIE
jgi:hypothetical protein